MLDRFKKKAHAMLSSQRGEKFAPVRLARKVALRANDALGRPIASEQELAERAAYEAAGRGATVETKAERVAAPVMIFHLDKHHVKVKKMRDVLDSAGIPYQTQNLENDPAGISATNRDAGGFKMPVVFIAGTCVGGLEQLINLNGNRELDKLVYS
jgi:glutaredoxin